MGEGREMCNWGGRERRRDGIDAVIVVIVLVVIVVVAVVQMR